MRTHAVPWTVSELVFEVVQEPDGGYCAECLTESIFTEGDTWDELRKNVLEATSAFFFDRPGLTEFAFTLSATKSSWWHEDSSRRFRRAPRRSPVPKMAVREGAPGRQPHHPGNRPAYSPPDRDSRPPTPSDWEHSVRFFAVAQQKGVQRDEIIADL